MTDPPLIWMTGPSTNKEDFWSFLKYIRLKVKRPFRSKTLPLITDRHSSHTCEKTMKKYGI